MLNALELFQVMSGGEGCSAVLPESGGEGRGHGANVVLLEGSGR